MKKQVFCVAMMATVFAGTSQAVEITANAGIVNEYVFRGVPQTDGNAAAQGGFDIAEGGFSAGTWASTVKSSKSIVFDEEASEDVLVSGDNGLEIDLYGAYSGEVGDFGYSIGATYYTYTDDFDDDYIELNLGGSWKWFSVDVAIGEYKAFDDPTEEYTFISGTAEYNGFYGTIGDFSDDFAGTYYEVGYGSTLSVAGEDLFDYSISLIESDVVIGDDGTEVDDTYLLFSIVKNFTLLSN